MKTLFMFLFIGLFSVSALHAQEAKVSMNIKNKSINDVFVEIKSQTPYSFWFDANDLDVNKRVTIEVKDQSVKNVLTKVLSDQNVEFKMNGNHIVITKKKPQEDKKDERLPADDMIVKMTTLAGVVKDVNGDPLPGVSVFLKGSLFGAMTDIDGKYTLKLPQTTSNNAKINFSLLGMKTQEIGYNKQATIDLVMEEDSQKLGDVVVTGYQNVDRRDMVGAYTTIKAEDIMMPAYSSIDEMLQGQVAGMIVTNTSVRAGTSPSISIRGTGTLLGNTAPLWVVDGIIQPDRPTLNGSVDLLTGSTTGSSFELNDFIGNQISWLNPNDIETITVLKDASATAIYGSRASNGVIVVTTKKGSTDRISVNYSANLSVSVRPTYDDYYLMNSKERINFSKEAFDAGANFLNLPIEQPYTYEGLMLQYLNGKITESEYLQQYKYLETVNTDWLKLLTRTAIGHNHNVSVNGGTQRSSYTASLGYNKTEGIEKGNDKERFSGRVRVGFEISPTVKIDMSMNGSVEKTDAFNGAANPLTYALNTSRAIPSHNPDGSLLFYKVRGEYRHNPATKDNLTYNILNELEHTSSQIRTPQFDANLSFKWQIVPELQYEFVGGYQNLNRSTEVYAGEQSFYIKKKFRGYDVGEVTTFDPEYKAALLRFGGQLTTDNSQSESYNIQNKLVFSKTFNKDHRLNAMAAWEVRSIHKTGKYNTVWGYIQERGEAIVPPTTPEEFVPMNGGPDMTGWVAELFGGLYNGGTWKSTNTTNNYLSAFATVAYSFRNRYVLNANFRNDVSNRFGQDTNKRFSPTFSFGAAWDMTEEDFMKESEEWLDLLKLRFTYGTQGNVLDNQGPEMILQKSVASSIYGQFYSGISRLANPLLKWERTHSWNVGLDLGMLKNRVTATFEYYGRKSNPVANGGVSPEYGIIGKSVPVHGTHIDNHGVEGTINVTAINKKDWTLSASINLSKNWNTVTKMVYNANLTVNTASYLNGQNKNIYEEDYPVGAFWAYRFGGLDPATGLPIINFPKDGDGNELTDYTDFLMYAGTNTPDITGGLNLRLRYKNLSLSSQFAAILGGKTFLANPFSNFGYYYLLSDPDYNLSKELVDRWRNPGDENRTDIPSLYTGNGSVYLKDPSGYDQSSSNLYGAWARSDARLVSKSFLRCRQISLSWYVDPKVLQVVGIRSLTLSGTLNNIFVIASSKYNGMDPELQTARMPKSFSFGLNVGF